MPSSSSAVKTAPVIVVSGLPRSGTSLMMNMLRAGGVPIVADGLRTADDDNPKGYFELERVKQLVGAHIGIDMRSPGQVKQAEIDGLKAEIELEQQQAKEAKEAEQAEKDAEREQKEAEEAEAKAKTGTARSSK